MDSYENAIRDAVLCIRETIAINDGIDDGTSPWVQGIAAGLAIAYDKGAEDCIADIEAKLGFAVV